MKKLSWLLVMGFAIILQSCGPQAAPQMPPKNYKTMNVERSNAMLVSSYPASIKGEQFVEIRPQVAGTITAILINEGAAVKKGQTLFIIDQVPYKAALSTAIANVKSAQAQVATAELNEKSRKALLEEKVISDFEYDKAKNDLLAAKAILAQAKAGEVNARNNLSYTEVKSPVDGVAGMIDYRVGALVNSSITVPLVNVSSIKNMYAFFSMSESQTLSLIRQNGSTEKLLENMPMVELELNDGSLYQHKGKVDAISGIVDASTGSVRLRSVFDNPEQMLRDGGNGRVLIKTQRENVIVIPKKATFELQNKIFVYKVVEGKATSSEITIYPLDNGIEYIVESGLNDNDVIIAEGAGLVREGTPIK